MPGPAGAYAFRLFLHAVSNKKPDGGKAWKPGYVYPFGN